MRLEHCETRFAEPFTTFLFFSEGPKGRIQKAVQFSPQGDIDEQTGEMDDLVATVVEILYKFCHRFPASRIYATGSTPARTGLYRMGTGKRYHSALKDFYIFGEKADDEWELFQKTRIIKPSSLHERFLALRDEKRSKRNENRCAGFRR